ncbi:hypothetical protein KIH87_06125 [Paraneptunicella aestuarii]|uniref:hypothetical protein n=1 Tax=Paraneptunicella aestuarii TaxID=2831148 RepID=UPI001E623870|nr:hypothetical protein [Paraneptunicella aestuarii]UAA39928.1 hypothetical protein KIH87_06125 [Paraneptunicella aestuarii]
MIAYQLEVKKVANSSEPKAGDYEYKYSIYTREGIQGLGDDPKIDLKTTELVGFSLANIESDKPEMNLNCVMVKLLYLETDSGYKPLPDSKWQEEFPIVGTNVDPKKDFNVFKPNDYSLIIVCKTPPPGTEKFFITKLVIKDTLHQPKTGEFYLDCDPQIKNDPSQTQP